MNSMRTKKRRLNMAFGSNPQNNNDDEEEENTTVEVIDNNIYFYCDVTPATIFQLIKHLRKLDVKLQTEKLKNGVENVHINLHINSYGGDLYGAFAAIDIIRTLQTPVHSYIEGVAASAATIISCVCDKRYIYKHAQMLIHQLTTLMWGKFASLEDEFTNCKKAMDVIKNIYKDNSKISKKDLNEILKHDLWWDADYCLKVGLVDKVL